MLIEISHKYEFKGKKDTVIRQVVLPTTSETGP